MFIVIYKQVSQILCEPCYNTLRTKEQLGYIVFCASRKANGAQGIRFIVQSAKHPSYVEERIELFLDSMKVNTFFVSERLLQFDRKKKRKIKKKIDRFKMSKQHCLIDDFEFNDD